MGNKKEIQLFITLWLTTYPDSDEDNLEDAFVSFYNLTSAKSKVYNWVESGWGIGIKIT